MNNWYSEFRKITNDSKKDVYGDSAKKKWGLNDWSKKNAGMMMMMMMIMMIIMIMVMIMVIVTIVTIIIIIVSEPHCSR